MNPSVTLMMPVNSSRLARTMRLEVAAGDPEPTPGKPNSSRSTPRCQNERPPLRAVDGQPAAGHRAKDL